MNTDHHKAQSRTFISGESIEDWGHRRRARELAALDAVMDAISAVAPDMVVNLGDLVSGPFDPAGSAEVQMQAGYLTIAGNHERQLQDNSEGAFDVLTRPLLTPDHWAWITSLPATLTLCGGDVFACHGSPAGGDLEYLLEDVTSGRAALDADSAIRPRLEGIGSATLVLCGHTHTPRIAAVDGRRGCRGDAVKSRMNHGEMSEHDLPIGNAQRDAPDVLGIGWLIENRGCKMFCVISTLNSERLILRPFRDEDLDPYAKFWATDAARFVGGPCSRADAWRWMSNQSRFADARET